MTPTQAIETLDSQLVQVLSGIMDHIRADGAAIGSQWSQLGKLGAQRDDHAAALLWTLHAALVRLSTHADVCAKHIDAMHADPFGTAGRRDA